MISTSLYVCELTERFSYGGRVAIGHVTKMSLRRPSASSSAPGAWPTPAWR